MHYILTAQGPDQHGLVEAIAKVVEDQGGNWLDSRLCRLGGRFAGIVRADFPNEPRGLPDKIATLTCHWQSDSQELSASSQSSSWVRLSIVTADRPGIVRQISEILRAHGANVEEFDSRVSSAPFSGELMFHASYLVNLQDVASSETLRDKLEDLAEELMCDLDWATDSKLVTSSV